MAILGLFFNQSYKNAWQNVPLACIMPVNKYIFQ